MEYNDGEFIKIVRENGKECFGILMTCDEIDVYKILILKENEIISKVTEDLQPMICHDNDGRLTDNNGERVFIEKIKSKFLIEELRQAYNLYVE